MKNKSKYKKKTTVDAWPDLYVCYCKHEVIECKAHPENSPVTESELKNQWEFHKDNKLGGHTTINGQGKIAKLRGKK
jgi:hypothetical protein